MANSFNIKLDDKPHLSKLMQEDVSKFKDVVGTFVNLMERAAELSWYALPEHIHTSLKFSDLVNGVLNAVMTTQAIDPNAYSALQMELHPLSLVSDQRKNILTNEADEYDWKAHFALDSNEVSQEAIEKIIRKILYLVRWFDIDSVSKALITNQFPVIDSKDIQKLPFQPALRYQQQNLGDLHVGKFFHDIGAFNCGEVDKDVDNCPACEIGQLKKVKHYMVCPRCNGGFLLKEELNF